MTTPDNKHVLTGRWKYCATLRELHSPRIGVAFGRLLVGPSKNHKNLESQMDPKKFVIGTVVGGLVVFFAGYLIFETILGGFFAANAGSATGVGREPMMLWSVGVGSLAFAGLICFCMGTRVASGLGGGVKIGAVVGLLSAMFVDFVMYGTTNISNLTATIVDPLASAVLGGIAGAVIGLVLAKLKSAS
jgi:hypothetical protein